MKESPTGVEVPGVGKSSGMSDAGCFPVSLQTIYMVFQTTHARPAARLNHQPRDHLIYDLVEIVCLKTTHRQTVPDQCNFYDFITEIAV